MTVIRAGRIGREYIKTAGHYHPLKEGTDTSYPEVYEVLSGRAHYLLQTEPGEDGVEALLIEAFPGDKVLIPPGYGHITINPGNVPLIMSNWVAAGFASVYGPVRELGGGAYFEIAAAGGGEEFIVNPNYRPLEPAARRWKISPNSALWRAARCIWNFKNPDQFAFPDPSGKLFLNKAPCLAGAGLY